jgi:3D-(3,5/4)-trihydroxycyclohexane-1,2-dione acylhydrolase (decyclizing)
MKVRNIWEEREARVRSIANAGGLDKAMKTGKVAGKINISTSEAVVLGLIRQNVRCYFAVFGHGSTDLAEVLRCYQDKGLIKVFNVRNEIEASHAACALRWVTGQKSAVVTSIGPGALQALSASLVPASDGIGIWYIFGDETTEDEGLNMQQIPYHKQGLFLQMCMVMGSSYSLHTPEALSTALRRGQITVDHPYRPGPFFLLLPMNVQPKVMQGHNVNELPSEKKVGIGAANGDYRVAAQWLLHAKKVIVRIGGGALHAGRPVSEFLELVDGVAVISPMASGVLPFHHPRNMAVGGSKGSLSGNYAMENADLLVAIGSRSVCQSDCSRTGYPRVRNVININPDFHDALHYNNTLAFPGDARLTLDKFNAEIKQHRSKLDGESAWLRGCARKRKEWEAYKAERYKNPVLYDPIWGKKVLTQPSAIKTAVDWAKKKDIIKFFDAGDVQANGFQIVEDDHPGTTFTETGASYMGFAVSALLATAVADKKFYGLAFTGDGSFMMNPQVLIDGVGHGARGCILLLDNRRMAAISGLQRAQYFCDFATNDKVKVNYIMLAKAVKGIESLSGGSSPEQLIDALDKAYAYPGLSLIHVPVYFGDNELGGLGVFGRWNVGNWCKETQALRHEWGL